MNPIRQTNIMKKTTSLSSNLSNLNLSQSTKRPEREAEPQDLQPLTQVQVAIRNKTTQNAQQQQNERQQTTAQPTIVTYQPIDLSSAAKQQPQSYIYYFRGHTVSFEDYKSAANAVKYHDNFTLNYLDRMYAIKKK